MSCVSGVDIQVSYFVDLSVRLCDFYHLLSLCTCAFSGMHKESSAISFAFCVATLRSCGRSSLACYSIVNWTGEVVL